jgi:hypothetical protein
VYTRVSRRPAFRPDPRAAAAGYIIHVSSLKYKQTLTAGESQINTTPQPILITCVTQQSTHHGVLRRTSPPKPTLTTTQHEHDRQLTPPPQPFTLYALTTSAWGSLQSLPLLFAPRLIVSLCSSDTRHAPITDLESYLSRTLGLTLLALAASNLIFTGVIPIGPQAPPNSSLSTSSSSSRSTKDKASSGEDSGSPPRRAGVAATNELGKATATVAVAFQAITAFYLYTQLMGGWSFAFTAGLIGNGVLFCFGTWTLLFGGDVGRVSKTTGADKRTSGFPFGNSEAAREKKRESRGKKSVLGSSSKSR